MIQKQRLGEIEILRGMAFAAVVLQHSIAHYSIVPELTLGDGVQLTLLLIAAKFAVPAFIFITGLVLFYNYDGELAYGSFIRKRFKDIVIPYLLWSLIYIGTTLFWNKPIVQSWIELPRLWLTGKSSYHLWYVVMIIPMYLLFPWLRIGMRKISAWMRISSRAAIGIIILITIVYELILFCIPKLSSAAEDMRIPGITAYFTTYADRNSLYFLYYFMMGALAGLHIKPFLHLLQKFKFLLLCVCGGFVVYYTGRVIGDFAAGTPFNVRFNSLVLLQPMIALFLIALVLFMYQFALRIQQSAAPAHQKFWKILSQYSYGGYLAHALMLRYTYNLDEWLFVNLPVTLRMIIVWAVALGLSVALTYGLSRVKWGSWLTGIPYRKAR